jgi:hypothetical protein
MNKCSKCGKPVKKQFMFCWDCYQRQEDQLRWREYDATTPQEREDKREAYYSNECAMCGKEGASPQKDGRNYCGTCWTVWNS